MQESEIPAYVGKVVGLREHQHIFPTSVYLLSGRIFGSQRDFGRGGALMFLATRSRQAPQKAVGRLAWTFGWPIIRPVAGTGSGMRNALEFLDRCNLTPESVFIGDSRGILSVRPGVLPAALAVRIVWDARSLIPPTGKNLSGSAS